MRCLDPDTIHDIVTECNLQLNDINKNLSYLYALRFKALVHGLVKNGLVNKSEIITLTGMSTRAIYDIVEDVEKLINEVRGE